MTTVKKTISIDVDVAKEASLLNTNFSAVVETALIEYLRRLRIQKAVNSFGKWGEREEDSADRLERLGEIKHHSPHWLMKEAIIRYLEQEEDNEKLNSETLARWQEAEQGKVVSHQAVSEWLDTWGTDEER